MKKTKIVISSFIILVFLIVISLLLLLPKKYKLSNYLDDSGDEVKIALIYTENNSITYLYNEELRMQILEKVQDIKFTYYPKNVMVDQIISEYSILIEGEYSIILNEAYIFIENKSRSVKEYYPENIIDELIELLLEELHYIDY